MDIYTMGFTKKRAEQFFEAIKKHEIELLVDVRLNNQSQLAGFTKGNDLKYFLEKICKCGYDHDLGYAPTKEILQHYKKGEISWKDYERLYNELLVKRRLSDKFKSKYLDYSRILLLCSEPTPERCHRRLLAEYLNRELEYNVFHI